jgi:hypothetical protein
MTGASAALAINLMPLGPVDITGAALEPLTKTCTHLQSDVQIQGLWEIELP